jgi:hypothetical protein
LLKANVHCSEAASVNVFCCDRDYRAEWERLRKEKKVDEVAQPVLEGEGKAVSMVTEVPMGQELADIYLKHPANESSEDEEGEKNVPHLTEEGRILQSLAFSSMGNQLKTCLSPLQCVSASPVLYTLNPISL